MASDDLSKRPTLSNLPAQAGLRVWLRFGDHDVEVPSGETTIGRSPKCQLVLDDALVSRTHARLVVANGTATIEDLGSANGVLINGDRLTRARVLVSGDRVVIGQQTFMLLSEAAQREATERKRERFGANTLSGPKSLDGAAVRAAAGAEVERTEATRRGHALELLGSVAEKVLALGRGDEAERVLGSYLRNMLQTARVGGELDMEVAEKAGMYATRIAEATGKGLWVDYVFDLYATAKRPLPAAVVDRLYESVRKLSQPVSVSAFRQYLAALREVEGTLGPSDRFLVRRIEGLEALGVLR